MSRTLKVTGNHVMCTRGDSQITSSRALCSLPSAKKQKHDFYLFRLWYNKTIITSVKVFSLSFRPQLITPTSTLIILYQSQKPHPIVVQCSVEIVQSYLVTINVLSRVFNLFTVKHPLYLQILIVHNIIIHVQCLGFKKIIPCVQQDRGPLCEPLTDTKRLSTIRNLSVQ